MHPWLEGWPGSHKRVTSILRLQHDASGLSPLFPHFLPTITGVPPSHVRVPCLISALRQCSWLGHSSVCERRSGRRVDRVGSSQKAERLRRVCQLAKPSSPQERPYWLPVHGHGCRYVCLFTVERSVLVATRANAVACGCWFAVFLYFLLIFASIRTGESGLGKSTLINTLFNTTLYPPKELLPPSAERPKTVAIESISAGMWYLNIVSKHQLTCLCA